MLALTTLAAWPLCAPALLARVLSGRLASTSYSTPSSDAAGAGGNVLAAYEERVRRGELLPDASQARAASTLQLLADLVRSRPWSPPPPPTPAVEAEAPAPPPETAPAPPPATAQVPPTQTAPAPPPATAPPPPPEAGTAPSPVAGAYLWGSVGSGKTLLMDLFAQSLTKAGAGWAGGPVLRQHFHAFMLDLHTRLHALQQARPRITVTSRSGLSIYRYADLPEHPLDTVAREIASRCAVLCLDELHVAAVGDAMVLPRLFERLLQHGTVVVLTSNRPPRELYAGGLSYDYFAPFARMAASRLVVLHVGAGVDYRQRAATSPSAAAAHQAGTTAAAKAGGGAWLWSEPGCGEADTALQAAWREATAGRGVAAREVPASYGRTLPVTRAAGDAALLTFDELCGPGGLQSAGPAPPGAAPPRPLSAPDYLALVTALPRLFVSGVPAFETSAQRDAARRFVVLLDVAYEAGVRLVVSASCPPERLFDGLLEEARRRGADTSLGLARQQRQQQQQQAAAAKSRPQAAQLAQEEGRLHAGAAQGGPERSDEEAAALPPGLAAEEVLMYHRAASRLAEMAPAVRAGGPAR